MWLEMARVRAGLRLGTTLQDGYAWMALHSHVSLIRVR